MNIGNTFIVFTSCNFWPFYPYVYREHNGIIIIPLIVRRFIPMYIGNTNNKCGSMLILPVYPYVYREHCYRIRNLTNKTGLSLCI